mgnify:CR=1 FL=1
MVKNCDKIIVKRLLRCHMNWNDAKISLQKIAVGTDINTKTSRYRFILAHNETGIKTRVAKSGAIVLDFPFLEMCYTGLLNVDGFNAKFLKAFFEKRYNNKPCTMHTVGQLFVKAGFAKLDSTGHNYFPVK